MIDQWFRQAVANHQQGRLAEAERLYRAILAQKPGLAEVLHLSGLVALQTGRYAEAAETLGRAVKADPRNPAYLMNLGAAQQGLSRNAEALSTYDRALALKPAAVEGLNNRGNVLRALGRPEQAIESFDRAIALKPDYAKAYGNRGNALYDLGRHQAAIEDYGRALTLAPGYPQALFNRGNALQALHRYEEALADYDRALAARPDFADVLNGRGAALHRLGRREEALESYDRLLTLQPDHVAALNNRGTLLRELGRFEEAATAYKRLIALSPDHEFALGMLHRARISTCDWTDHARTVEAIVAGVRAGRLADLPSTFLAVSSSASDQLACARAYAAARHPPASPALWTGEAYGHDRIRLAYVSADFRHHVVAQVLAGLFEAHDRAAFDVTAISLGPDDASPIRKRLEAGFETFIDARGLGDEAVAGLIRARETDIVIDLQGYSGDSRPGIFAHRPAPLQVNAIGHAGTMGASYYDYILADRRAIPEGLAGAYAEAVVSLPGSFLVNTLGIVPAPRGPGRADEGLPDEAFVFCCFNDAYKITPQVFEVWMRLLNAVPGSVLWLRIGTQAGRANLRREAEASGVNPDRLVFAEPRPDVAEHLARQGLADLFLDTLPYNAHAMACDALLAGVPIVTCMGEAFASRVAGSLLHTAGLSELAVDGLAKYEAVALRFATSPGWAATLRERLAAARKEGPLFDARLYARHLEAAWRAMHERRGRGLAPEAIEASLPGSALDRRGRPSEMTSG